MDINILPIIPARYCLMLIELLKQRETPLAEILEILDVSDTQSLAEQGDRKFSLQQVEQVVLCCLKYPQNYDLAFEFGKLLNLSAHSLVGYVMLTSETLLQAQRHLSQYFKLVIPNFKYTIQEDEHSVSVILEPTMPMNHLCLNFHLEANALAMYHSFLDLAGAHIFHYHIYLSLPKPHYYDKYQKFKWANFHFQTLSTPSIQAVFSKQKLNAPLPMANPHSLNAAKLHCQELMQHITEHGEVVAWLKMILQESHPIPTLSECAKLLNTSTRTLQSEIQKQGENFQNLRTQIVMERAKYLLQHTQRSIAEIADELGYSTASNFARTFKLHTQYTPLQYRQCE